MVKKMNNTKIAIETLIKKLKKKGIDYSTLPTAIYARKSSKDTSQVSIDGQVDACEKFINDNPQLKLVETYSEENVTGYHMENRKQIQSLIRAIKKTTKVIKPIIPTINTAKILGENIIFLL